MQQTVTYDEWVNVILGHLIEEDSEKTREKMKDGIRNVEDILKLFSNDAYTQPLRNKPQILEFLEDLAHEKILLQQQDAFLISLGAFALCGAAGAGFGALFGAATQSDAVFFGFLFTGLAVAGLATIVTIGAEIYNYWSRSSSISKTFHEIRTMPSPDLVSPGLDTSLFGAQKEHLEIDQELIADHDEHSIPSSPTLNGPPPLSGAGSNVGKEDLRAA